MNKSYKKNDGSVTVEAAIVLPIFICVILTIGFFIRVYYIQEILQHAITEAVNEMSSYSYIYYKSGLYDLQKEIDEGLKDDTQLLSHLDNTKNTFKDARAKLVVDIEALKNHISEDNYSQGLDSFLNIIDVIKGARKQVDELMEVVGGLDVESLLGLMAEEAWREGKTSTGGIFTTQLMKKHLITSDRMDLNKRLLELNIVDGLDGIDFSDSKLLENNQDIEICIKYKIALPLPIKIIDSIPMKQRAVARAWMGGDISTSVTSSGGSKLPEDLVDEIVEAGYDIWSLPVFQRGREIKGLLGMNVNEDFPIVDKLEDGIITSIRSHDTRLKSNQGASFGRQLREDLRRILEYSEATFEGISIGVGDYVGKELNLVFPDVELDQQQINTLYEMIEVADSNNIKIKITVVK